LHERVDPHRVALVSRAGAASWLLARSPALPAGSGARAAAAAAPPVCRWSVHPAASPCPGQPAWATAAGFCLSCPSGRQSGGAVCRWSGPAEWPPHGILADRAAHVVTPCSWTPPRGFTPTLQVSTKLG